MMLYLSVIIIMNILERLLKVLAKTENFGPVIMHPKNLQTEIRYSAEFGNKN